MSCQEAPVARRAYADAKILYPAVYFLGIIGNQSHQTHKSGHNCGAMRELAGTDPNYAHAVDIGVGSNSAIGFDLVERFRKDPRVWYVIYKGRGYRPWHRGGGTFTSFDHESHVHVSFGAGSTFQVQPFFGAVQPPAWVIKEGTKDYMRTAILQRTLVKAGFDVDVNGVFGSTTTKAVKKLQGFLKMTPSGSVGEWTMAAFENWVHYMKSTGTAPWVATVDDVGGKIKYINTILKRSFNQKVSRRKYTKKTQQAVRNAQRFLGRPVTGNVTAETLEAFQVWDRYIQGPKDAPEVPVEPPVTPVEPPVEPEPPVVPEPPTISPEARHELRVSVDDFLVDIGAHPAALNLPLPEKLSYIKHNL